MTALEKALRSRDPMMEYTDYVPKTTFWTDFCIAEVCGGIPAIKDTFKRAMEAWKDDVTYLTELVMILNHKIWYWYDDDTKHSEIARVYNDLWKSAAEYAETHLTGDDLSYYYRVTD